MQTTYEKIRVITYIFVLNCALIGVLSMPATAEDGCIIAKCHQGMLKGKNIHPAAEPCETCHQAEKTPHPRKNVKTFKLTQEVPALCAQCHAPFGSLPHVHEPVRGGMCTGCHNPHDSSEPKLLTQPVQELCLSCHPDKNQFKFVHGPAATGDCTTCHNPHESKNKALVIKAGAELCYSCHTDMQAEMKKKTVHPALEGGCTSCHNPHGSEEKKFFPAKGAALCYQCHPQVEEKLKTAKSVHPPIVSPKGCASCHAPHSSDAPGLLPKTGKDLCLDCHKGIIKKTDTVLHGPIKGGKCTPCHDPHGTPFDKLLTNNYTTDFYVSYDDSQFQFCFSCHNRDLLRNPTTSYATGFRDGDKNLHYLHVNRKDRGKSCKDCHVVHGGTKPKLLADQVLFGKWSMPIKFIKTETGGGCAPGCHQKYSYDRKTPGKEAIEPKAGDAGRRKNR
jgi:predicted CXXCH cytochrome family protein